MHACCAQLVSLQFKRIWCDKNFEESLPDALIEFSGGSAGVFGSLVELTFNTSTSPRDGQAWKQWFETEGFAKYVECKFFMFQRLQDEWLELTGLEWRFLIGALGRLQNVADPLVLQRIRGDLVDVEKRLEQATKEDTNANDSSHQQHSCSPVDGYTRMCRRIRVKYLSIIADDLRQPRSSMSTSSP